MPAGGVDRDGLPQVRREQERGARRRADPAPLPRLLRPGLRRLRPARLHGHGDERAGGPAQPDAQAGSVQGHQRHPRPTREGLRPRRLLRRHRRPRRTRLRPSRRRPVVQGAPGPARRPCSGVACRRARRAPGAELQRHHPPAVPRQDQAGHDGPGGALRRAHRRHRPLHLLREPPLPDAGPDAEQVVRRAAAPDVPRQEHHQHDGERHPDPQRVRQQVLRGPAEPAGALHLRPGPLHRRPDQAHRHQVRRRPGRLLRAVRLLVRQDGADQRAHAGPGADPSQLLRAQRRRRRRREQAAVVRRGDRRRQPRLLDRPCSSVS